MVRVSVIMGVHNGAGRVGSAVDSILKQLFPDLEMIICDDASSDDTYRVLEDFAARDDRLVLLHNQSNLGLAGSLNRCLDMARGDYIARMDDDDVSLPGRLRAQVAAFDEFRDCSILGGAALLFDEKGEYGRISPLRAPTRLDVFRSAPFVHPTVMMRREHLMSVGGYTVAGYARRTEDYDLWNKMYSAGYSGRNLNECVLRYYKGRDSYSKTNLKIRCDELKLRRIWQAELNLPLLRYAAVVSRILLAAVVPNVVLRSYHRLKFSRKPGFDGGLL